MKDKNEVRVIACSFCGKAQDDVRRLVGGQQDGVYICNDCVALCCELLREEQMIDLGQSDKVAYFQNAGDANTDETIRLAVERAVYKGIKDIVVASSTGATAVKVAKVIKGLKPTMHPIPDNIIAVTLHAGIWKKYTAPDPEKVKQAEEMGVKFLTCTHSLMGNVGTSIMEKFGGINLTDLIAHTYYTFSQGTKVAVEIVVMAADAGLIPVDGEVISIAGTDTGADTALVIKPAYCTDFFSLRIREIIAKPR